MARRKQRKTLEELISQDTKAVTIKANRKVRESYSVDPDWDNYTVDDIDDLLYRE